MSKNRRRSNLPNSRLQLKVVGVFLSIGLACLFAQFLFGRYAISELTALFANSKLGASEAMIMESLWIYFLFAGCLLVPLTISAGILVTFRIAGPAYRMERYLRDVASGADLPPCTLRKGDDLQELCDALNAAVDRLKADRLRGSRAIRRDDRVKQGSTFVRQ